MAKTNNYVVFAYVKKLRQVMHKGILYSTLTLFSTVLFLIVASHINNWKMDRWWDSSMRIFKES
jgi:hypothetical protein